MLPRVCPLSQAMTALYNSEPGPALSSASGQPRWPPYGLVTERRGIAVYCKDARSQRPVVAQRVWHLAVCWCGLSVSVGTAKCVAAQGISACIIGMSCGATGLADTGVFDACPCQVAAPVWWAKSVGAEQPVRRLLAEFLAEQLRSAFWYPYAPADEELR